MEGIPVRTASGRPSGRAPKKVCQFELLEKPSEWNEPYNPNWPDWPKTLKTSSSHEEGCERDWSIGTKQFTGEAGRIRQGHFTRLEWKQEKGKPLQMTEIPGSEFTLDLDLVLLAMGFLHVEHNTLLENLGVEVDNRGNIRTDGSYATTSQGVFSAGDAMTGASLVVRAIWHGREAAKACNSYLVKAKR